MKKLNLNVGGIRQMLNKEQMKKVVGGYGETGGGCSSSACDVSVQRPDGKFDVYHGVCQVSTVRPPGLFTDPIFVCGCSAQPAGTQPTSNGGVSRCNT